MRYPMMALGVLCFATTTGCEDGSNTGDADAGTDTRTDDAVSATDSPSGTDTGSGADSASGSDTIGSSDSDMSTDVPGTAAGTDTDATDEGPGTDTDADGDTSTKTADDTETPTLTGAGTDDSPADSDPGAPPLASLCPGRLEPVAPAGLVEVVGDGTPSSCTEAALQAAVERINGTAGGGTLTFHCGGPREIELSSSVYLTEDTILDGNGEVTLSGGNRVRVIELDHHLNFVLQRMVIRDGFVAAGSENESGAGLLHPWFGTLKVIDVRFENNHSASEINDVGGGAIYAGGLTEAVVSGSVFIGNSGSIGGGMLSRSTNLRVVDTTFVDNTATTWADSGQYGNGGGLYIDRMWLDDPIDFVICGSVFENNHAKVHGSALFSYNLEGSGATIERCAFQDNDMADSPGGGTGSVYHEGVPLLLKESTFSGNVTGSHAGGLFLGGGSDAEIENCTFANNRAPGNAGALWAGNGTVTVTNVTFAGNDADYGPAIFKGSSGTVTLKNVIFSGNTTANEYSAVACHETFEDGGGNIQWPDTKNNGNADTPCAESILFADPELAPLDNGGGFTETMALPAGSPAIDVANDCPETDQRGMPRVGRCDAGAFENQG